MEHADFGPLRQGTGIYVSKQPNSPPGRAVAVVPSMRAV